MTADRHHCARCNEALHPDRIAWLELDSHTGLYTDPAVTPVSPERSQGCFAFGRACARSVLRDGGRCTEYWMKR